MGGVGARCLVVLIMNCGVFLLWMGTIDNAKGRLPPALLVLSCIARGSLLALHALGRVHEGDAVVPEELVAFDDVLRIGGEPAIDI